MATALGNVALGAIGGGLFGGSKSLSPIEKANLYYGQVGKLRARAAAEENLKRRSKLERKITRNEAKTVKVAAKQDMKAQRTPVKTFAELEARRSAYEQAIANPAPSRSGTRIVRSL
jgi:hypothetical protein